MKQQEWFWSNINDIKATLTSCDKCGGECEHTCDNCKNLTYPFCEKCNEMYASGEICPKCNGKLLHGCDSCNHTGYVPCAKCEGKGYQINSYELDGKSAPTIDALYRKFKPVISNRPGEVVRLITTKDGYNVAIDRNNQPSVRFGVLDVSETGWLFQVNGEAHAGKIEDGFLDNARNVIFELYCEATQC